MGDNRYKQRHKGAGLCVECSSPVVPGLTRCAKHATLRALHMRDYHRKNRERVLSYFRERRKKLKESHRCIRCGAPLKHLTTTTCPNCSGGFHRWR